MEWKPIFYNNEDGEEPVKNFILKQPYKVRAEILHVLELLKEFNVKLGMPYVRKIDKSGVRELRIKHSSNIYRIFFFAFIGRKFILLHAIVKKADKIPQNDIDLAVKRMNDYKSRY